MKRLLSTILALIILISTFTACSYFDLEGIFGTSGEASEEPSEELTEEPSEEPPETMHLGDEQTKDELFGIIYNPDESFNPITTMDGANQELAPLMYEGLFVINPDFEAEPAICESYLATSDLRTYTFTIRSGLQFSDGSALTAYDVEYSLTQAWRHESSVYSSRFHAVDYITALSDRELEIILEVPYEELPLILDIPVIKSGTIESKTPIGSGAYVMKKNSQHTYLQANTYWREVTPLERIYLFEASTTEQITDMFQTAILDLVSYDPTGITPLSFHNDYEFWNYGTSVMQYIGFNFTRDVFKQQAARVAVSHIVNREEIVRDVYGGLAAASSLPAQPGTRLYSDTLASLTQYDPNTFEKVLEEAGYTELPEIYDDGFLYFNNGQYMAPCSIVFIVNSENNYKVEAATRIAKELEAHRFKVDLQVLEYEAYMSALRKGEFDMFYGEVRLTADFDLYSVLGTRGNISYGDVYSPELDEIIYSALENSGAAYDVYEYIIEQGLLVPVLFKDYAVLTQRGNVVGIEPTTWNSFYNLYHWEVDIH